MRRSQSQLIVSASSTALLILVGTSLAANVAQSGSGVVAYFGSQSGAYTAGGPPISWTQPGPGTYPTNAGLPGLPAAPTSISYPLYGGGNFQTAPVTHNFNDLVPAGGNTIASSTIADSFVPTGATQTADANITIPSWTITQGPAVGPNIYAYEQLNFGAAYTVSSNPGGMAGSTPSLPLFISGTFAPGGYVQFDGVVRYDWIPVLADGTLALTPTSLGQINYTFTQLGGGPFSSTISSTGAITATPTLDGVLEITGHFWLAGDPFTATITSLPEPGMLSVIGIGTIAILRRKRR